MKTDRGAARAKRKTASSLRTRALVLTLAILILSILIYSGIWFVRSYNDLGAAIQIERMDYVKEISAQIINSQQFMREEYSDSVAGYAGVISRAPIASLSDVRALISSKDARDILLVSKDGDIRDLNGDAVYMSDRRLLEHLPEGDEVEQLFNSLNYEEDNWLFVARVDPVELDGDTYIAVVLAIAADDFRENLAISLFGGRGASYVIRNDGSIEIMAADKNLVFDGYNLLSSMLQEGASQADVEMLKAHIKTCGGGNYLFKIGGQDWLISHSAIDGESSIVVTVPLALTAVQTYEGLSRTIIFASATVLGVAAMALLIIMYFFYRDRLRGREAMAVAAKSDFFSKMSHDIRTPLSTVIGLVLLAKDSSQNPKVKDYLEKSASAAKYLLSIINDVLDMSRIESGKLEIARIPFDMNQLIFEVDGLASTMAAERELKFVSLVNAPFKDTYMGDSVRLKQIIINLLSNAIKFTKKGGTIELRVSHQTDAGGTDKVRIVVSDTGVGMSKAFMERLFTAFEQEQSSYTRQFAGSGLGLSIARSLILMMKGEIDVESVEDVGSTFTVTIPLERAAEGVHPQAEGEAAPASYSGHRVLLVEDNAINQQIARTILENKFQVSVETANDGREAVNKFAMSGQGYYSLVLMDIKMPVMDGLEATRQIRALSRPDARSVPIVALSANAFDEDVALSLAAGMNDHLSKPIDIAALAKALGAYLKEGDRS